MPTSSNAGSVEVQAPPGLEAVSGFRGPSPLVTAPSTAPGSSIGTIGPSAPPKAEGFKDELVREVTAAVREHIECKTAAAVDQLWQKGQRAMQHLQEQQLKQTAALQSQLAACAEAHQQLQRENAMLRSGLEALMKHLTLVFGPPPHVPGMQPPAVPPAPPSMPPVCTPTSSTTTQPPPSPTPFFPGPASASPQTPAVENPEPIGTPVVASASSQSPCDFAAEDFHTPAGSPMIGKPSVADDLNAALSDSAPGPGLPGFPIGVPSCGGTGSECQSSPLSPTTPSGQLEATFSLTLRRADNVPLGLEVVGEPEADFLLVEAIRPGGAVEAWNRQCHGDSREIRAGDRILMINGAKEADAMRKECLERHLLRMSVARGPEQRCTNAVVGSAASTPAHGGLRADADEFVPQQARPWSALTSC
jgi:hypothetical protein